MGYSLQRPGTLPTLRKTRRTHRKAVLIEICSMGYVVVFLSVSGIAAAQVSMGYSLQRPGTPYRSAAVKQMQYVSMGYSLQRPHTPDYLLSQLKDGGAEFQSATHVNADA